MKEVFRKSFDILFEESFEGEFADERELFATIADANYEKTNHLGKAMTSALKSVCQDADFYNEVYVPKYGESSEVAPRF